MERLANGEKVESHGGCSMSMASRPTPIAFAALLP
jgi:hypothetical protein